MKALSFERDGELEFVEVAIPTPAPDQLLIQTAATTICSSDLHDLRGNPNNIQHPMIMGHEGAGTIVAIGTDATGFAVGDRIAAHPVHSCGSCPACLAGFAHLCQRLEHFGLNMPGTFAEFFCVRSDRARRIPDTLSWEAAALTEPVCVCLEALARADLTNRMSLLIVGDGPFGVLMARLCVWKYPTVRVVIAGRHETRLQFANGADQVVLERSTPADVPLLDANDGDEYGAVILTAGGEPMVATAVRILAPRGRLVIFAPMPGLTGVDLLTVLGKELEIVGAVNDEDLFDDAIAALAETAMAADELVTHRFPIDEFEQAFALAEHGHDQAMKIAIVFPDN